MRNNNFFQKKNGISSYVIKTILDHLVLRNDVETFHIVWKAAIIILN